MAQSFTNMITQADPIGQISQGWISPDGLQITQVQVPIGVIGLIYESRPNVAAESLALSLKSGNALILKGGKEAKHSNQKLVEFFREALSQTDCPQDAVQLLTDNSRAATQALMRADDYVDVLIPRGSANLIRAVRHQATVPVIETGAGICHVYVHEDANLAQVIPIIINSKTQRPSVCNAMETLVIHESRLADCLPKLEQLLVQHGVEICADELAIPYLKHARLANESDWDTEYLDLKLSIKSVASLDDAITFINAHSTHHSEAILTNNLEAATHFQKAIDSAVVYVNASTRFTDGSQFGFGAEIGISTQKLHVRGPIGLNHLTSQKYLVLGNGQIRN
jgi:glutamate-5-semialdehyde dehydrogenase